MKVGVALAKMSSIEEVEDTVDPSSAWDWTTSGSPIT